MKHYLNDGGGRVAAVVGVVQQEEVWPEEALRAVAERGLRPHVALARHLVQTLRAEGAALAELGEERELQQVCVKLSVLKISKYYAEFIHKVVQSRRRPLLGLLLVESTFWHFHI